MRLEPAQRQIAIRVTEAFKTIAYDAYTVIGRRVWNSMVPSFEEKCQGYHKKDLKSCYER